MLLNYLKLSLRLLLRSPFFTTINVVGLAVGFASFYSLWGYSVRELQCDQYHPDQERIARIGVNWNWTDDDGKTWGHLTFGFCKTSLVPQLGNEYSQLESTLRVASPISFREAVGHDAIVQIAVEDGHRQRRSFKEERLVYADSNLFNFFAIPLIHGEKKHVLQNANDVALSESIALKYFGETDPTGKLILLNDSLTLRVTGVFENLPGNTHLNFDIVVSNMAHLMHWNTADFVGANLYVKLKNSRFQEFEEKINAKSDQYWANVLRLEGNVQLSMFLQPLQEIPFSQNYSGDNFYPKSKPFLLTLIFIALSVLVMGWVNYVNLSITRISKRFKEIATRKVSGARPIDLISQFVTEAVVINGVAILLAFTFIQAVKAPALGILNIDIQPLISEDLNASLMPFMMVALGVGFTGIYPALVSMTHQPGALYSIARRSSRWALPNFLSTIQFAVAIVFILLCFNVSRQINFILGKDIGIRKDRAIVIETPLTKTEDWSAQMSAVKNLISNIPTVESATNSKYLPTRVGTGEFVVRRPGSDLTFGMDNNSIDEDFISFFGLKVIAGREFVQRDRPDGIVISRFATTRLGFNSPEEAVGANLEVGLLRDWKKVVVVGVIEDFRASSFLNMNESSTEANNDGRGIVFLNENHELDRTYFLPEIISVRMKAGDFGKTLSAIELAFARQFPEEGFRWAFVDDKVGEVYRYEKFARNQVILFTSLAILIACLGLLGMISNKVIEKTKEIGIRKVLGAEIQQIARILLNTTFRQIVAATVIGIPLAYYLSLKYFDKFSERIEMPWWYSILPVLVLVGIMLATVSAVVWKAARSNPVEALKSD